MMDPISITVSIESATKHKPASTEYYQILTIEKISTKNWGLL